MRPLRQITQVAQQHIDQQGHPDLPAHGVGVVTQEIGQLQRLLDLLEEHFDLPPAPYRSARLRGLHSRLLVRNVISRSSPESISTNSATTRRINSGAGWCGLFSTMTPSRRIFSSLDLGTRFDDRIRQVNLQRVTQKTLRSSKSRKLPEVHVTLAKQDDFPAVNPGTEFARPLAVCARQRCPRSQKLGSKLCRLSRMWVRRRLFAAGAWPQSIQLPPTPSPSCPRHGWAF